MIAEPKLIHIPEPKIAFGHEQTMEDPRDGLTLFGAYSRDKLSGQINVGVIGPAKQRNYLRKYLEEIHKPVIPFETDVARPYFPGLEADFDIYINFNAIQEIDVPIEQIKEYLRYIDGHQRIFRLTNLYSDRLTKYYNEEHAPVTLWFVIIPDDIYRFGKPKSKIPKSELNIKFGLTKSERKSNREFLFEELNVLREAYEFEINFHNQLKAKLLKDRIITQIIRESTIAYETIWSNEKKINYERKFNTAKVWNLTTTLYYKIGGIPWKLSDVRKNVCYLGLVYKKTDYFEDNTNACCAALMFLDSGDGIVFKGNIGPWYNPDKKEFHISSKDALVLLSMSLESFKEKSETNEYPKEIFIHAKTYFDDDEWGGVL